MALFHLNKYKDALESFELGLNLAKGSAENVVKLFEDWISKCSKEIDLEKAKSNPQVSQSSIK